MTNIADNVLDKIKRRLIDKELAPRELVPEGPLARLCRRSPVLDLPGNQYPGKHYFCQPDAEAAGGMTGLVDEFFCCGQHLRGELTVP